MAITTEAAAIRLVRPRWQTLIVSVKGTQPLITHAWSEKAKRQMLENMMTPKSSTKKVREPRDPHADFESSMYRFADGGHGFPTLAFKSAAVTGGGRTFGKAVRMTELRQAMQFVPDGAAVKDSTPLTRLVLPEGTGPIMREDTVRHQMTTDLRYRAQYNKWEADLTVRFQPAMIEADSVVTLLEAGGVNGIGEWRPEKDGLYGTFTVVGVSAVEVAA